MDEVFIDITARVDQAMRETERDWDWIGKVYKSDVHTISAPNKFRPMDVTLEDNIEDHTSASDGDGPFSKSIHAIHSTHHDSDEFVDSEHNDACRLRAASHVVNDLRKEVLLETGFKISAGISGSKTVAKLASSLNKPNGQAIVPLNEVKAFLGPMRLMCLNGIGYKMSQNLSNYLKVHFVHEVMEISKEDLCKKLATFIDNPKLRDRTANMLWNLCRGRDLNPVTPRGRQQSFSVEDSFPAFSCTCLNAASQIVNKLAIDFVDRIVDEGMSVASGDTDTTGVQTKGGEIRIPRKLVVKWRQAEDHITSTSSCAMPPQVSNMLQYLSHLSQTDRSARVPLAFKTEREAHEASHEVVIRETMRLIAQKAKFPLTKISLTAIKFEVEKRRTHSFQFQLTEQKRQQHQNHNTGYPCASMSISKKRQRMMRENTDGFADFPSNLATHPKTHDDCHTTKKRHMMRPEEGHTREECDDALENDDAEIWTELADLEAENW